MKGAEEENAPVRRRQKRRLDPLFEEAGMKKAAKLIRCLYVSITLALAALLVFCVLPGPPVMAAPLLKLNVSSGPVGTQITIAGTVFDSYQGDSIHILFDTTEINNSPITIPADGTFTLSWAIPADIASGAHTITAKSEISSSSSTSSLIATATFTVDPRQITLNVNEGPTGTQLTIGGTGFYVNEGVTLSYANPAPGTIGTVTASSLGKFTRDFTIPVGVAGLHNITAQNARGNTAAVTFRVLPGIELNVDSGAPGEQITVHGTGFGKQSNVSILLDTLNVATVAADEFGTLDATFTIPSMELSTHYLKARDNFGNNAQVVFPVIAGAMLSETTGAVGQPLTVTGNGFQPGSAIKVTYDEKPVASATADNNGRFTVTFNVPSSISGDHVIAVTDGTTTRHYSYAVEKTPPPAPALTSPAQKSVSSAFAKLNWQTVTDPSIPVTYELEIADNQDFTGVVLHKTAVEDAHYVLTADEALKAEPPVSIYYWRVMAIDGAGNRSPWSETWSFVVGVPTAPALTMPDNGDTIEFPINFNWSTETGHSAAVTYNIQVSRNDKFNQLLVDEKGITSGLYIITPESKRIFDKQTPYYWRVRAIDSAGNAGDWSAPASFKVSSSGFPAWATYTLIVLGAVIMILLAFRYGRRTAYH